MNRVFIISPYRGDLINNVAYAHAAIKDCFGRGEAPYASHIMNTEALNDDIPEERKLGVRAGWAYMQECHYAAVYKDFGITDGMLDDIEAANRLRLKINKRSVAFKLVQERTQELLRRCAAEFGITVGEMRKTGKGDYRVTSARDAFCYLSKSNRLGKEEIGALVNMSGQGVYNALARAEIKMVESAAFRAIVAKLK